MDLGLSPVLVLAILLQGHMPAHAWLEDDSVSVYGGLGAVRWVQFCQPCQHLQLAELFTHP